MDLVIIVKKLSNSKRLKFEFDVYESVVNVPENVLDENRKWINIVMFRGVDYYNDMYTSISIGPTEMNLKRKLING